MAQVFVRDNARSYVRPGHEDEGWVDVVRVVGLETSRRDVLRIRFLLWLHEEERESPERGCHYDPRWLEYAERPTWFDVHVPGMHLSKVNVGIYHCLLRM